MKRVKYQTYQKLLRERGRQNKDIWQVPTSNGSEDLIHIMNKLNLTRDKSMRNTLNETNWNYDLRERKTKTKTAKFNAPIEQADILNTPDFTLSSLKRDYDVESSVGIKGVVNLNSLVNSEWLNGDNPEKSDIK